MSTLSIRKELLDVDPEIAGVIRAEIDRQNDHLELIASENYSSAAVRAALGSVLTDKYAEGYPGRRWYHGCEAVDEAERLAIERAKALFGADHVNMQPHAGSQANMAVYMAAIRPGARILGMDLAHGGHLTHGHTLNFSGRWYEVFSYGVERETGRLDYDKIQQAAEKCRPDIIVAGASAYSRFLDFKRFRDIADSVGAVLMVDMAHIAGLVATKLHPDPVPHADFVSSTTHKTLRGPRSGFVLCRAKHAEALDRAVFPGLQGGPMMHVIAAKAVALLEASRPSFKTYQQQVLVNAKAMAGVFIERGFTVISGGTDTHLFLVDVSSAGLTGKQAANLLSQANITVNKNAIPFDPKPPAESSGIRIGTPAMTTRGLKIDAARAVAGWICDLLKSPDCPDLRKHVSGEVLKLCRSFPVFAEESDVV